MRKTKKYLSTRAPVRILVRQDQADPGTFAFPEMQVDMLSTANSWVFAPTMIQ